MFDSLALPLLLLVFVAAAAVVWVAGTRLSDTTDILSRRLHLGSALGGLILLAIATNLPELAITTSAALSGDLGIAVGNILGGIAIQTVVLALLDVVGVGREASLAERAASLVLVLEGTLVVAVLVVAIMGSQLPPWLILDRFTPAATLIALIWVVGIWMVGKAGRGLPWRDADPDADRSTADAAESEPEDQGGGTGTEMGTGRAAIGFAVAAAVTLVAGVVLERSGTAIASAVGMSGVLFGATILAAATALPEVSTGLESTKLGDYQLAVSDILGGNAFLPVLFLLATLISGEAVLPQAEATDIYLAGLGILLTTVYIAGWLFRSRRQILRMGVDSLVVLLLYAVGIAGLVVIASG